ASYAGGVEGYAATSPEATGRSLADGGAAVARYAEYVEGRIAAAQADALALVPNARMIATYATVYGGYAMTIPANRAKDILALGSVAAVQENELRQSDAATPAADPTLTPDPSAPATPEKAPATEAPATEAPATKAPA